MHSLQPKQQMKKTSIKSALATVVLVAPLLQGCIAQRIMDSEDRKNYSEYRMQAERLNTEREKAGLAPQKILTFDEWRGKE